MSGPMEFNLGPPRFGTSLDVGSHGVRSPGIQDFQSQVQDGPGLGSMGMVLGPPRFGTFQDEIWYPSGLGSAGTAVGSPRVRPHGDRFGTSLDVGPCRDDRCRTS